MPSLNFLRQKGKKLLKRQKKLNKANENLYNEYLNYLKKTRTEDSYKYRTKNNIARELYNRYPKFANNPYNNYRN